MTANDESTKERESNMDVDNNAPIYSHQGDAEQGIAQAADENDYGDGDDGEGDDGGYGED